MYRLLNAVSSRPRALPSGMRTDALRHLRSPPAGSSAGALSVTMACVATIEERDRLRALLDAGIALSSELSLDALLQKTVEAAVALTGARYAALGVIDEGRGGLERFIQTGIDPETHAATPSSGWRRRAANAPGSRSTYRPTCRRRGCRATSRRSSTGSSRKRSPTSSSMRRPRRSASCSACRTGR